MSKAEELANELMDEATYDLHHETIRRVTEAAAELRRLAALEKAIMDAEPKGWLCVRTEFGKVVSRCIAMNRQDPPKDHRDSVEPLYTLNGIKKP